MMQRSPDTVPPTTSIAEFRRRFPLGSTGRVVMTDLNGRYLGIIETAKAFDSQLGEDLDVGTLAGTDDPTLVPADDVHAIMKAFDASEATYLAVIGEDGQLLGTLSERFVHRRYTQEIEKAQREMFRE